MLKNISKLEIKIGEKTYQFLCDMDCPLHEVKESLFQFIKYVGQIEDKIKEQQEAQKSQEDAKSVVEPIVEQVQEAKAE